ncbi:phosphoribosyltransferase family protein [Microbacterium sp. M]|uniref:phosphoribosyltransferase family protein n=1 Tax=Microbacterium sp. M TaxID=3377125 RepID=UPI0038637F98
MTVTLSTRIGPGYFTTPTFEAMQFPAGEAHIKVINENDRKGPLTEIARVYGADGNDLMLLAMWADAAERRGARAILQMPYLPGARADHADFIPLGAEVYAQFINALHVDQVICFDPHSPAMPAMIEGVTVIDSTRLVREHVVGKRRDDRPQHYDGIIAPDKGAVERAQNVAIATHLPLYRAEKVRDQDTGKLSGFTCDPLPDEGRFLVVDDICDGGGTFAGLAKVIDKPGRRLGLYVSHGVFSGAAADILPTWFSEIWTTDSFTAESTLGTRTNLIPLSRTLNGAIA